MGTLEAANNSNKYCRRCGRAYGSVRGSFSISHADLYKGAGFLPYCKECVDDMYEGYMRECKSAENAVRQMCRKLDLYWNKGLFDGAMQVSGSRSVMTAYLTKINNLKYAGYSYDTTLREEMSLWTWPSKYGISTSDTPSDTNVITDDIVAFWGPGYTPTMYEELQQRYHYWLSKLDNDNPDIGVQALLRQIVSVEIDINRDRAAGKNTEKSVKALMDLLGSAQLKPAQRDNADAAYEKTTFGEWIEKWEEGRPVPEPDPELQDVDGIKKYITVWFFGHLCKSLGIKNAYSKLYEDEIARLRVEKPEYDDDDDDTFVDDIFGGVGSE